MLITLLLVLVALIVSIVARSLDPTISLLNLSLVTDAAFLLVGVSMLWRLHWFTAVGFTPPSSWRSLRLYWLPILLVLTTFAYQRTFHGVPWSVVAFVLLVGLAEETLFRGLVLQILLPEGVRTAVFGSALLFAGLHFLNALSGDGLGNFLFQAIFTFSLGVTFALLRLRTNTLLPLIALHASFDLITFAGSSPASPLDVPFNLALSAAFLLYGLHLFSSHPQPAAVPSPVVSEPRP